MANPPISRLTYCKDASSAMCGITGFWKPGLDEFTLARMTQSLAHRGPDDQGTYLSGPVGLGHARLSVMDTSSRGHQPMTAADGRTTIVFNGEVYNHRQLRNNLDVDFRSNSDTEIVLEQFARSGVDCLKDLDGMFAMAVWDSRSKTLTLARDRFGIKPLYYWQNGNELVFGSEIKAILASGLVSNELSWQGLHEFLHYGTTLGETTSFEGIKRLPPGHTLEFSQSGIRITKFADIHEVQQTRPSYEEAKNNVRQLLEESVERHLVSDVPVGVFLSGGIDSVCITALASKYYGGKLKTYSAAFDFEPENNELEKARAIANHFGTEHHELTIRADNVSDDIEQLVAQHDVPFGDIANLPLYLMCKELNGETKVILQGDGGDEIFGGYHRYSRVQHAWFYRAMHYPMMMTRPMLSRQSKIYRAIRTVNAFSRSPKDQSAMIMSHEQSDQPVLNVMSEQAKERLADTNPHAVYHEMYKKLKHLPTVQRMLYTDSAIILPDLYFEKVDRATMAKGVEVRVPMLDNKLCRYAMSLPWQYKVKGRQKKRILRDALRGTVPTSILDGPKKGLNVPFRKWLQKPLNGYLKSVLLDSKSNSGDLFNKAEIEKMISTHTSGKQEHGMLLYKLLVYTLWHEKYIAQPIRVPAQTPMRRTA